MNEISFPFQKNREFIQNSLDSKRRSSVETIHWDHNLCIFLSEQFVEISDERITCAIFLSCTDNACKITCPIETLGLYNGG